MSETNEPMDYNESTNYVDPSTVSMWPTIQRFGLIGGLVMIVIGLVSIIGGFAESPGMVTGILFMLVVLGVYIFFQTKAVNTDKNDNLGGYISFGRAFSVAFLTGLIMALLGLLFNVIYMGFIDPDYMARVAEGTREMYEGFGMSEEDIDKAIEQAAGDGSVGSVIMSQVWNFVFGTIVGAIVCVIIAAVTKKEAPGAAA